ncbi:MAG TPA: galactokinase [Armatimonadota bacterium]|nr:galactokinase [Armatimonadota bacterium]HPO72352.1 galactokinase [Armatimonadota bacterium]HPT98443.1 galactokinase [Armatimonadota bacterium]
MTTRMQAVRDEFARVFGGECTLVRAPGRVNLIGEHTDYNEGFVFPVAIDREVRFAVSPRDDRKVVLRSLNFDAESEFSLSNITKDADQPWSNYVRGIAAVLQDAGHVLRGMNAVIEGNVPLGSGLSSSAAMEIGALLAFEAVSGFQIEPVSAARLAQKAENQFVGVNCGIMDQFISRLGRKGHALLIDCRTLSYEPVPVGGDEVRIVVADSKVKRGLVDSEYNKRRAECERAVVLLSGRLSNIGALRDVTPEQLAAHGDLLADVTRRRARHVVTENDRCLRSVEALRAGDLEAFGKLMNQSHISLRDDYEVSCRELDILVEAAWAVPGVLGSRMTGAGFGGCTVSLVRADAVERFRAEVSRAYEQATGRTPEIYVCSAEDGAGIAEA